MAAKTHLELHHSDEYRPQSIGHLWAALFANEIKDETRRTLNSRERNI